MRAHPIYIAFCLLMLAMSGFAKLRGIDAWLFLAGDSAASTGRSGSSGSGGYFGTSSSHK